MLKHFGSFLNGQFCPREHCRHVRAFQQASTLKENNKAPMSQQPNGQRPGMKNAMHGHVKSKVGTKDAGYAGRRQFGRGVLAHAVGARKRLIWAT